MAGAVPSSSWGKASEPVLQKDKVFFNLEDDAPKSPSRSRSFKEHKATLNCINFKLHHPLAIRHHPLHWPIIVRLPTTHCRLSTIVNGRLYK
ncbi:hypothetical protein MA16_Dca018308 [Dendrobium catenatum]|uniref:Uncharacterized protein n=1 Tax=Dendrobium catenatum TaxID=906689 RepID=A0A2I0WJH5_9ASPA|nr:hypothetical protein MA16_Dca018308 [Dendrobium catenatum]